MVEGPLTCWKEIATYVGKTVRTVQRWERELGMPVHRPNGRNAKVVCAFPAEISRWMRQAAPDTPAGAGGVAERADEVAALLAANAALAARCADQTMAIREARARLRHSAHAVAEQVQRLGELVGPPKRNGAAPANPRSANPKAGYGFD